MHGIKDLKSIRGCPTFLIVGSADLLDMPFVILSTYHVIFRNRLMSSWTVLYPSLKLNYIASTNFEH